MNPTEVAALRLELAARGYLPIPLHGKIPPMENWQKLESVDRAQVEMWGKSWPDAVNTGILCRDTPTLDLDILDPDAVRAIVDYLHEQFDERGYVDVRTGLAPKAAIPFRTIQPFSKIVATVVAPNGKPEKVEFLASGQQFAAYGTHPETRRAYAWHGSEPLRHEREELPHINEEEARALVQHIVDEILVREFGYSRTKGGKKTAGGAGGADNAGAGQDWSDLLGNIHAGENLHDTITPLAMKLLKAGMGDGAAVNLLRGMLEASAAPRDMRWQDRWNYIPRAVSSAREKLDEQAKQPDGNDEGHWHGEVSATDSRTWVIHDLVPEVGKGLIAGQWGTFKTFTALEMAHSMMSGAAFLGCDVVRRGGIAFFALEGQSEIPVRLQALIDQRGLIKGNAPFVWYDDCPSLLSTGAVDALAKRIGKAAAKMEATFGVPLVAVFIDTIVLAAGYTKDGADNDTATTNVVLRVLAELATKSGCFVFGIDHFGKDVNVGTRGNSVKEGNADLVLALLGDRAISGEISNTKLAIRKRRGGTNGQEFPFTPKTVDMGVDQHRRSVTTLVLDWGKTAEPPKSRKDDWGKGGGKLLRQIVMSLLAECGVDLKPFADGPMVKALEVDRVRAEFFKRRHAEGDNQDAKRRAKRVAFQRAVGTAVDRGVIATRDVGGVEYVWLTSARAEMHGHVKA